MNTPTRLVPVEQISSGTMDQIYLALRLAAARLLQGDGDQMPLIFDDSFVFYDDRRLARTLSWIGSQGFSQVILFTCQHREMDALERLGVAYTPIYMDCN